MYDVLIIGGGPAGIYCGYVAHNKGLKAILVESNDSLGGQPLLIYSQKPIYDYPAFCGIKAYELTNKLIDQLVNHSETKVLLKTTIKSYSKEDKLFKVTLTNNEVIETKAIIIACGGGIFKPNRLENISSENKNIHYLVQPLDVYKNKKVVVLGGGDSAVDWANELISSHITDDVSIVHRRDQFRANGENVEKLSKNKIKIFLNCLIEKITNKEIVLNNKKLIPYDFLIVQYGQSVDNSWKEIFKDLQMNQNNRIPVKQNQMTNLDNIYAIGNVCIYEGKPSSIVTAHGEATVAVRDIINKNMQIK